MTGKDALENAMKAALADFDTGLPLHGALNFWASFVKHSTRPEISRGPFGLASLQIAALQNRECFKKVMEDLVKDEPGETASSQSSPELRQAL